MIDIHTHIIPNVDDGAKSLEEALILIKEAKEIGITAIILTPHISSYRKYAKIDNILKNYDLLKNNVSDINLYLGYEIDYDNKLLENINKYSLNNTKYVLIDYTYKNEDLLESIYNMKVLGYYPIICHPERYLNISYNDIVEMKAEGAYIQVTAKQIKMRFIRKLIKHNLIDFIASDIHKAGSYHYFLESYQFVKKIKGTEYANKIFIDNPKKLLEGERLDE